MNRKTKQIYFLSTLMMCAVISSCAKKTDTTPSNTTQTTSTSLQMTIYDGSGATMRVPSPGATVQLYTTVQDQQNKTNPVTPVEVSNSQAVVLIKNLQPINYYFNAYSADGTKSNATTFNQTDPLTAGVVNYLSPVVK